MPALDALRALVAIPTVSHPDPADDDVAAFDAFHAELARQFPRIHADLDLTPIGRHGLLVRWRGRSQDRPVVLMAHLDVVGVDEQAPWQHPPFSADVVDRAVWGRGTLDDKGSLVALFSAVEGLLAEGFVPAQDVWLSVGDDEEVGGSCAEAAVAWLEREGVRPRFVLDEGGAVAADALPGVKRPVAVIGVAEKGTTDLRLVCEGRGGHSSTPAAKGPTWRIARALMRLERSPMPARLPGTVAEMMRRVADEVPTVVGGLLRRADRLEPVLVRALGVAGAEAAAMTRTTIAATTLSGSPGRNVLATRAEAGLNARILPGDTVDDVMTHVRKVVRDRHVTVELVRAGEATPVSPSTGDEAFELLEGLVARHFREAMVTPYLVMGATDARHFTRICDRVYRFTPLRMSKAQRASLHSYDEHLLVGDLEAGVAWYRSLVEALT
ncbi:M20/M25/M40 family metallo-hydrolase [Aestuariimicrobium ganziense]|uniref:M20/M25/M40 family metallo-hydrolase n=1 Tax=Aestuariimicrobium ganziense TaxID=2773677 RepID=UPI001F3D8D25|nr:M20/M25/M40 family metallo-hydrolase [Aestuariimicrobium ganziense]